MAQSRLRQTGYNIEDRILRIVAQAENAYWDNATILKQAGLIPDPKLPILGAESAQNLLSPTEPLNELIRRSQR